MEIRRNNNSEMKTPNYIGLVFVACATKTLPCLGGLFVNCSFIRN